jgi:hypothetical protein
MILFVQDSMLLTLFKNGDKFAQSQVERDLYRLSARDRERMMEYQIERLKHFLFKAGDRREEQNLYLNKAESRMVKDWNDAAVSEPLAVLLGGGKDKIEQGQAKLRELRKLQVQEYIANLEKATFFRKNLNGRMLELLES